MEFNEKKKKSFYKDDQFSQRTSRGGSKFFLLFLFSPRSKEAKSNAFRAVTRCNSFPMVFSSLILEYGHWHLYLTTGRLCSAVRADKLGRENEWAAPDETELPSMRCPHANEHDNRRKVMSDRMAMVCHKCNHVGYAGYETR